MAIWARYRWKLGGVILALASIPAILDRVYPVGPLPGSALFVFLMLYFAGLVPLLAFQKPLPMRPWTCLQRIWAWSRAVLCSLWVMLCIWGISAGFGG